MTEPPVAVSETTGAMAEVMPAVEMIAASLAGSDGLACFNRMYREATQLIGAKLEARFFAGPAFMNMPGTAASGCSKPDRGAAGARRPCGPAIASPVCGT